MGEFQFKIPRKMGYQENYYNDQPPSYDYVMNRNTVEIYNPNFNYGSQIISTQITRPVIIETDFGRNPVTYNCHHCHQVIQTEVRKSVGVGAWMAFGGFCIFGCWLGCC